MRGIVYASQALAAFDDAARQALQAGSAARNAALGISGYLYLERDRFVHYLEGDPVPVGRLMARIERDRRHAIQHVLVDGDLRERRFATFTLRTQDGDGSADLEALLYGHLLFMKHARLTSSAAIWRLIEDIAALRGVAAAR